MTLFKKVWSGRYFVAVLAEVGLSWRGQRDFITVWSKWLLAVGKWYLISVSVGGDHCEGVVKVRYIMIGVASDFKITFVK